ncbi:hypothetical protein SCB49_05897 [unidentified eubacterium SCB49]|nr:hypothetical protein SCB49_05897 [unidentified eubacterium SCB49]
MCATLDTETEDPFVPSLDPNFMTNAEPVAFNHNTKRCYTNKR